jgi:glutamate 5-kinase
VLNEQGEELARGIVNYNSQEVARIKRKPSHEIETILGYVEESELIHRDNMVVI